MAWRGGSPPPQRGQAPHGSVPGLGQGTASLGQFPLELPASWEARGVPEAFALGPHATLLGCGLGWFLLEALGDELPPPAVLAAAVALALLAAAAAILLLRRRARRVVLVAHAGEIGVYREERFAYRFPAGGLRKDAVDWLYLAKMLAYFSILVLLMGGILAIELRDFSPGTRDLWVLVYVFGYACFALAAVIRSQLFLVWYWIPEGPEGTERRIGLPRRRARAGLPAG